MVAVAMSFVGSGGTEAGGAPPPDPPTVMDSTGCQAGAFVFLSADPKTVQKVGQISSRWNLQLDGAGRTRLYLDTATCEETVNGRARTVVWTQLAAQLDSAHLPSPERTRSTSNVEGKPNDLYLIAWDADDRDFVRWLQAGTGLGDVARFVPRLRFQMSGVGIRSFEFDAPSPTRSPFQLTARFTPNFIPVYPVTSNIWRQTRVGSVMFEQTHDVPGLYGFFQQWAIKTDAKSPLGQMIGGGAQGQTCTAEMLPAPLTGQNGQDPGCLGVDEHDGHWTVRKTV
jgi:hypothetical protein